MKLKQLSIFLENSPGHLKHICEILAKNQINLDTIMIAESASFGVVRAIVNKPEEAVEALGKEGVVAKLIDVLAVEVENTPGALLGILQKASQAELNLEYMYALRISGSAKPIMVMRFNDITKAETLLS